VRIACKAANITSPTAYWHREKFPDFAAEWDNALELAIDFLEMTARKRAAASSDTLLIFLLKAHRPEKYRETTKHEISGPNGGPIEVSDAKERLAARLSRLKPCADPGGAGKPD
jgi:hypothetical protein